MPAITPSFVYDLESRMRKIQVNLYAALAAASNQWNDTCTKVLTTGARKDVVTWILETAQLASLGRQGGNIGFDDMVVLEYDYEVDEAGRGLKLQRKKFEDLDGNGVNLALAWVKQQTSQAAYWRQKRVAALIAAGETGLAYDGQVFFSTAHPNNPYDTAAGSFSNRIANVPIDASVSRSTALDNLATVFATIRAIKMPNGVDPRFLEPKALLVPPALFPIAAQLTEAKLLAQVALAGTAGGGSASIEGFVEAMGYAHPTQAAEFAGTDTDYYVVCKQQESDEMGALIYVEREPFSIRYYTGRGGGTGVDAVLDRADELEWHHTGRNIATYGHPYLMFKCCHGA